MSEMGSGGSDQKSAASHVPPGKVDSRFYLSDAEVRKAPWRREDVEAIGNGLTRVPERPRSEETGMVIRLDGLAALVADVTERGAQVRRQKDLLKRCLPVIALWISEKERTGPEATGLRRLVEEIKAVLKG